MWAISSVNYLFGTTQFRDANVFVAADSIYFPLEGYSHLQLNSNFLLPQLCCTVPLEARWVFSVHLRCCGRGKLSGSLHRQLEAVAEATFRRDHFSVLRLALLTLSRQCLPSLHMAAQLSRRCSRRHQSTALALVCTRQRESTTYGDCCTSTALHFVSTFFKCRCYVTGVWRYFVAFSIAYPWPSV